MEHSKASLGTMDRIAIAAIVMAAAVIVALVVITARAQMQVMPAAALVAMATHVELPAMHVALRRSALTTRLGRI